MMQAIVNVSPDWGIGMGDRLLVAIRADLQRFRALTTGSAVVLGRKTLQTFPGGRPLKYRRNIILSTQSDFTADGAAVAHSLDELFSLLMPEEKAFVIGGESVYRLLLPYCERALITKSDIHAPADRFFPNLDALPNWRVEQTGEALEENGVFFRYVDYVNSSPLPFQRSAPCTK